MKNNDLESFVLSKTGGKPAKKPRTPVRHEESALQRQCVAWFRLQYPEHALMLFAVPNGGGRSRVEAAIMKAEGVTAGVADLILLETRGFYGSLCIEMKTESKSSRQRSSQKIWQRWAERWGNVYAICRTFEEFRSVVSDYMSMPMTAPIVERPRRVTSIFEPWSK